MNLRPKSLIVLESTNPPDGTTRYIDQVVSYAPPNLEFRYLSARNLFRRADIFHVHWPEVIVRGRNSLETLVRAVALRAALVLMKARRTAIVRTMHNLEPHESGSRIERRTLKHLDERTTLFVAINPVTAVADRMITYIPHGHYRDRFSSQPRSDVAPGRLLYAGLIRPYKGVERLIEQFPLTDTRNLHLRIVGKPTDELRTIISEAAASNESIEARFGFLDDDDFVREITAAEMVCLPYEELHNSGVLLVALSLNRPVIAPRTATTEVLSEEVGPGWLHLYDGVFTAATIDEAFESYRSHPPALPSPQLDNRSWETVGRRYAEAFERAASLMNRKA